MKWLCGFKWARILFLSILCPSGVHQSRLISLGLTYSFFISGHFYLINMGATRRDWGTKLDGHKDTQNSERPRNGKRNRCAVSMNVWKYRLHLKHILEWYRRGLWMALWRPLAVSRILHLRRMLKCGGGNFPFCNKLEN